MKKATGYVFFRYDMLKEQILGTKTSFNKANKGYGDAYEELIDLMSKQPTFTLKVIEPKKPEKAKQSYKGMDCDFMRDYLIATKKNDALRTFNQIEAFAKNNDKSKYPLAKKFFLKQFPKDENGKVLFDYTEAKIIVKEYRDNQTMEKVAETKVIDYATAANL